MAWPNKKKAPDDYFIPLIHPVTKKPCPVPERGWRNPSPTMKALLDAGLILFGKDEST
jgi:adenine-specific DNA-methyltransferase